LQELAKITTAEDLEKFKQYVQWLKAGEIELDAPFVFEQPYDDKEKRAHFH